MNHVAFDVAPEKIEEYRERLLAAGVDCTEIANHDDSEWGISDDMHPGVFVRSVYFQDPDGILLEFACWMREFTPADVSHVPAKASTPRRTATGGRAEPATEPAHGPSRPRLTDRPTTDRHRHPCPASARSPRTKPPRPSSPPCTSGSSRAATPSPSRAAGTAPPATGGPSSPTAPTSSTTASRGSASTNRPTRILDPKLRELGQIRAGWAAGSQFVFSQHAKSMRELGMPEEQITHIPAWSVAPEGTYDAAERAVLAYTDCLVYDHGRVPDELFAELQRHLDDVAILELTYITTLYFQHAVMSQGPPHRVRRPRRSHRRGARTSGGLRHASGTEPVTADARRPARRRSTAHARRRGPVERVVLLRLRPGRRLARAAGSASASIPTARWPGGRPGSCGPAEPGVCSVDYRAPVPPGDGLVSSRPSAPRTAASGSRSTSRRPLEEFRLAATRAGPASSTRPRTSTPARRADGPAARLDLDLTWTTDGVAVPLRPDDPLRDPLPRLGHRHHRRRDVHGRRAGPARPLLGRARLVGLRMVLVLDAPRRRHPGPPGRHPHGPRRAGLLRIHPDARPTGGRRRAPAHRARR